MILPDQQMGHRLQRVVTARGDHGQVEVGELLGERGGGSEVGFGQAQDRNQPAGIGGDERPIDQPGARRRVGKRHHDQQLVGVGHDHPLGGIGVICGAPQQSSTWAAPYYAGQRVVAAGQVADDVNLVTDDDRCATQFAGPHRGDPVLDVTAQCTPPAAPVDADHRGPLGVGMLGPGFGPRA